jgi:hypothetical protein
LGLVAALVGAAAAPVVLLAITALFAFPFLFWSWRGTPGKGYGWLLLGSIAWSAGVLYWRVPQPTPIPQEPQHNATATVRQVRVVDQIWTNYKAGQDTDDGGGQGIRRPFQMVDLEFTPAGASDSIHVLDRVDLDSVPGLHEGARIPICYSSAQPSIARIVGGTRNYAQVTLVYLMGLTYAIGGALAFVVFPAVALAERLFRSCASRLPFRSAEEAIQRISRLPANDPRRKAIEKAMRSRQRREEVRGSTNH